jgi:hypothetical protein
MIIRISATAPHCLCASAFKSAYTRPINASHASRLPFWMSASSTLTSSFGA